MAKHTYNIIINDVDLSDYHQFRYTYNRMEMQVSVSNKSFIVIYETNTQKSAELIWQSREVEDAIRKCLLAQLIYYGHNVEIEKAIIKESGTDDIKIIQDTRIFNLIPSDVEVDLAPIRDDNFVAEYLMKRVKSKYEAGIAALFSYIYAKSKKMEEERFTYLWRSFNGIYSSIAKESVIDGKVDEEMVKSENNMLKNWLNNRESQKFMVSSLFNKIYAPDKKDYTTAERKIRHFFYQVRDTAAKAPWSKEDVKNALNLPGNKNTHLANLLGLQQYISPQNPDQMQIEIEGKPMTSSSSLYGYLMTELAYQIRCEYFHAAKPILLHTTKSNPEYRALELANALLEHYLDEYIIKEVKKKINLERFLEKWE